MKRKERLEDINVMQGIDFEKNQRRSRRIQERLKKQQRVHTIIYGLIIALILTILMLILNIMSDKAYNDCIKHGMDNEWCEVHVQ